MADYRSKATTEVIINGEQAKNELKKLESQAEKLKQKIAETAKTKGIDSKEYQKAQRELKNVNKQMDVMTKLLIVYYFEGVKKDIL